MIHFLRLLAFILIIVSLPALAQTSLSSKDAGLYREAFLALDRGRAGDAMAYARRAHDDTLERVVTGEAMGLPGNSFRMAEIMRFIEQNPDWYGLNDLRRMVEEKMPHDLPAAQQVQWFSAYPAVTAEGFYFHMDGLLRQGRQEDAARLIRARWIEDNMTENEMDAFHDRYTVYLGQEDHWARLDRLLWDQEASLAMATARYLSSGYQALARARLGLAQNQPNADGLVAAVPDQLQMDPGLLFERLRWRRKNDMNASAIQILNNQPAQTNRPDLWWNERHIMARRLIENRDMQGAYELCANHGQTDGMSLQQAEFLAGWLAMRFMGRPDEAAERFKTMYDRAGTPISKARAAYWLGRAADAQKNTESATQWFGKAATYGTTFYGQLALERLGNRKLVLREAAAGEQARTAFWQRPLIRALWQLKQISEYDRLDRAFAAASAYATKEADFVLLTDLAKKLNRKDLMVKAAKDANMKGYVLAISGYPLITDGLPNTLPAALVHGIIRQESMFRRDALSPAGAKGMMQLMPATANQVARAHGIKIGKSGLYDPATNIKLGSIYLKQRIDGSEGNLPMAIAGYNAGPARVQEWIKTYGDPRQPEIDPVDWIEVIPIYETRNYVQRVLENMQVYRARLNGNQATVTLREELR